MWEKIKWNDTMNMTILEGDIFHRIKEVPDETIDLCITSPPYWGLRDYGVEGQLGNEPTMEDYLDNTMKWVKEVWRVLKPSGSFVLNIGDTFFTKRNNKAKEQVDNSLGYSQCRAGFSEEYGFYKSKQLLSVSSFAYCRIISETDFVCRGEHIWAKPNVPSPIRSRLKHSHEKLFWFVKDADKYYFDDKVWSRKTTLGSQSRIMRAQLSKTQQGAFSKKEIRENWNKDYKNTPKSDMDAFPKGSFHAYVEETIEHSWRIIPVGEKQQGFEMEDNKPQSEHIAPFPTTLIEPYIKSLCPLGGVVLEPFLGSGTTMRVAMENNRDSIGIELNHSYIEYAKKRLNWGMGLSCGYHTNISRS